MKKPDYILLILLILEMILTFIFRNSLNLAMLVLLTSLIPLLILPILGGRISFHFNRKYSLFDQILSGAIATIISLPYSLLFPWSKLIKEGSSSIHFSPNLSNIISTLIVEIALSSLCFIIIQHRTNRKGQVK